MSAASGAERVEITAQPRRQPAPDGHARRLQQTATLSASGQKVPQM